MTVLGIHREAAAEQPDAVAKVDVAAVFAEVAADFGEAVAGLERVGYVVVASVLAAGRTGLLGSGGYHLLRQERAGHRENPEESHSHGHHLRKYRSLLDP